MNSKFSVRNYVVFGLGLSAALAVALGTLPESQDRSLAAASIQISPEQFARYSDKWSEPEGFFDSDNFISNETAYLQVMSLLQKRVAPGGVYIGVGPDQNFSYIAETKPDLAIIIDIRRQNMLQHFLYKALFDLSASRSEYLALLFSREAPALKESASFEEVLNAVRTAATNEELFITNLNRIKAVLLEKFHLHLSAGDLSKIEYVYRSFWQDGLDLRFSTIGRMSYLRYPTYQELMLARDMEGRRKNFLASNASFQWMKTFEAENRLIPVVGDFAGAGAFKAVAGFLKENGLRVSTFYTSNVEFYLFGRPAWDAYMQNLRVLPFEDDAVFIRAYFATYGRSHPLNVPGNRSTSLVQGVQPFIDGYEAGNVRTYWDVVKRTD
jgi:hypothetical protein